MRNRAYRANNVKQVNVAELVGRLAAGPVWIGLDVGKFRVLCVVRDAEGRFERPWRIDCPKEIGVFVTKLKELAASRALAVAMEPTGTYGDALRQALCDAGLEVRRVSGKAARDYAEIFDGVPSAHDGKDAAVIAELAAIGKSAPWPLHAASTCDAELSAAVAWLDAQQRISQLWLGKLEGLLSRHWPEAARLLALGGKTLLCALARYGGPAHLAADGDAAAALARWGRGLLKPEKIEAVLESARTTVGVRMHAADVEFVKACAAEALTARGHIRQAKRRLAALAEKDAVLTKHAAIVGPATACVLRVAIGDPRDYHCGEAYRKAMGLNLKERSSGRYHGKLKITKRGPSLARRWLYFAALRLVQQAPVRTWYEAKRAKDKGRGNGGVVAVMRKLALALYAVVVHEENFSLPRLIGHRASPRRRPRAKGPRMQRHAPHKGLSPQAKSKVSMSERRRR